MLDAVGVAHGDRGEDAVVPSQADRSGDVARDGVDRGTEPSHDLRLARRAGALQQQAATPRVAAPPSQRVEPGVVIQARVYRGVAAASAGQGRLRELARGTELALLLVVAALGWRATRLSDAWRRRALFSVAASWGVAVLVAVVHADVALHAAPPLVALGLLLPMQNLSSMIR